MRQEESVNYMIPFNIPPYIGTEEEKIGEAIAARKISGDGVFTKNAISF